ncbi:unnamed protein product [Camellia sinensis]
MNVRSEMHHIDSKSNRRDYLSAGKTNLPLIYFFFFLIYTSMAGIWTYILYIKRLSAYHIHFFMLSVLILKALNFLCEIEESYKSIISKTLVQFHFFAIISCLNVNFDLMTS